LGIVPEVVASSSLGYLRLAAMVATAQPLMLRRRANVVPFMFGPILTFSVGIEVPASSIGSCIKSHVMQIGKLFWRQEKDSGERKATRVRDINEMLGKCVKIVEA
jgi:hypothetical protein